MTYNKYLVDTRMIGDELMAIYSWIYYDPILFHFVHPSLFFSCGTPSAYSTLSFSEGRRPSKAPTITTYIHYPRSGHHCRFKIPFTVGFWTGSDVGFTSLSVLRTASDVQAILWFLAPTDSVSWANTVGLGSSRQWCSSKHCRLVARANSDAQTNNVGLWLELTVMLKPTLPACGSSRQWCSSQHYRLELWTGSVAQDITAGLTCKPAVISFSHFIVLYNFFIFYGIGFPFIFAT